MMLMMESMCSMLSIRGDADDRKHVCYAGYKKLMIDRERVMRQIESVC